MSWPRRAERLPHRRACGPASARFHEPFIGKAACSSRVPRRSQRAVGRYVRRHGHLQALEAAGRALEQRLAPVGDDKLDGPSSCGGWSVYDLVNHVNGGGHRYLRLMQGAWAEQLTPTRTRDHVRPDPVEAYRRWQRPLTAAFTEPGALDRIVHHPVGERSGLDLLRMRTLDLTLHAWDLARSLDLDLQLDEELSTHRLTHCLYRVDELRGHGLYGSSGEQPREDVSAAGAVAPHRSGMAQNTAESAREPRPVAVVTGRSRSIGTAVVLHLAQQWHDVVVAYRRDRSAQPDR